MYALSFSNNKTNEKPTKNQQITIDRGIRNTSRQISFEFLFIKTCPPDNLHTGFRRGIE